MSETANITALLTEKAIQIAQEITPMLLEVKHLIQIVRDNNKDEAILSNLNEIGDKIDDLWKFYQSPDVKKLVNDFINIEKHDVVTNFKVSLDGIKIDLGSIKNNLEAVGKMQKSFKEEDIDLKKTKWKSVTNVIVQILVTAGIFVSGFVYMHKNMKYIEISIDKNKKAMEVIESTMKQDMKKTMKEVVSEVLKSNKN